MLPFAMMPLPQQPSFRRLVSMAGDAARPSTRELFSGDPRRFERFSARLGDLLFDYSKHDVDEAVRSELVRLAEATGVPAAIEGMFAGHRLNLTEDRAVLHVALRSSAESLFVDGADVLGEVRRVKDRLRSYCDAVRTGQRRGATGKPFSAVVNLGIGGSDLGPRMVCRALARRAPGSLEVRFVSNVDGSALTSALEGLSPETTLFVVASKTFTTQETMANARSAKAWLSRALGDSAAVGRHFVGVTTAGAEARAFGIAEEDIFGFWDWVGGRFSLWSSVGLSIALALGMDAYEAMLAGAEEADHHLRKTDLERNIPVLMGLLSTWHATFKGRRSQAVVPYDDRLALFPAYLQQLEMESNGKSVDREGRPVEYATSPVVWGAPGTDGQHAFFQLLHQGTDVVPVDFLAVLEPDHGLAEHHRLLLANLVAQAEALLRGRSHEEAIQGLRDAGASAEDVARLGTHRVFGGNRPSSVFLWDRLDAGSLGRLVALYEHKVLVQGMVWNLNSFDQFGVELGKTLATRILGELQEGRAPSTHDGSTQGLMRAVLRQS